MAKVMVSIPDDLLDRIDRAAQLRGVSRSALLRDAAARDIDAHRGEDLRAGIERTREMIRALDLPPVDSTELIRQDRDTRDDRHDAA